MKEPIWLSVARAFVGISEIAGQHSAPVILRWSRDIAAPSWYDNDDKPWCAVFLNRLMQACQLPMAGSGFDLLRARSFASWGRPIVTPALGAIVVFQRDEGAHVGLYLGERKDGTMRVLGGNQGNAVSEAWISAVRLIAVRWPDGVPLPLGGRVQIEANGERVSVNEA